jgi:hypothetical protein
MEEGRPKRRYALTTGTGTEERERKAKGPAAAPHSRSECRSQKRERAGTRRKWPGIETGQKRGRSVSLAVLGKEGKKHTEKRLAQEQSTGRGPSPVGDVPFAGWGTAPIERQSEGLVNRLPVTPTFFGRKAGPPTVAPTARAAFSPFPTISSLLFCA